MKRKLFLLLCALLTMIGVTQVKAYTVSDLTSAGWTQVTDLTSVTLADNYFMFVDAGTSLYSVTNARPGTDSKPTYQALQNPTADWAQVWKLSKDAQNNYLIQSNIDDWYFISAANANQGWTDKMSSESTNGGFTFGALGSNKYSIKGVYSNGFVGPWNDDGAVNLNNNLHWGALDDDYYEELACNKSDTQSPDFYIFYISRTSYDAARRSSATLETEGWSKVTETSGLGKAGYYYTFLDLSETNYETGLAMIGTNGRPKYTSVADPVANTVQLWTTESHNEGYALKNVGVDKYLYLATNDTWNTGFTSDINSANTTFVATVSEGKWTLSNSLNTSQFVGRWSNSPYAPGTNEDIAANKAADAGKRQFYIYSIPTIAGVAEALPGNGDMVAGTWYKFTPDAGRYNLTVTNLANIVYTTDGSILTEDGGTVIATFGANPITFSATTYYIKSSSANNFAYEADSYDVTALVTAYNTAVTEAGTAKTNAEAADKVNAAEKTALDNAITTYGSVEIPGDPEHATRTQKDALETATAALTDATSAVNTSITAYTNAKAYFDAVEPVLETTNFYTSTAYTTNYSTLKAAYEAGTLSDDAAAALSFGSRRDGNMPALMLSAWSGTTLYMNTWSTEGNTDGSGMTTPFYEYWVADANTLGANTFTGTIDGLDASSLYSVEVLVRIRQRDGYRKADNSITLKVGDGTSVDMTHGNHIGMSRFFYDTYTAYGYSDEDGNLTVTITVAANSNISWLAFKNILYAHVEGASALDQVISEVTDLNGHVPTNIYGVADAIVTSHSGGNYPTTDSEFETAISDIRAAAATAATYKEAYEEYLSLKGYADALVAVTNDNASANSTLETAISTAATNANSVENVAALTTVNTTLKTAMVTYAGAANPVGDGNKFNLTFMLNDPDLTGFISWEGKVVNGITGWNTEQGDGNSQVMENESVACSEGDAFFEYWSSVAKTNDKFALYLTTTLPEGTYSMSCYAFASPNGVAGADDSKVYFYANDTQGDLVSESVLTQKGISFVNTSEQEVKIGLKTCVGNEYRWMGIGYVELYKVPEQEKDLDENHAWDNSYEGAGVVNVTRTFKEGVNTVVFPFSMTQSEVEDYFGTGSVVYQLSSYEPETGTIHFTTKSGITANEPCLVKATSTDNSGAEYRLEGRTIVATGSASPSYAGENVTMTGSYAAIITVDEGNYIISGSNIYLVNSDNVKMKNTRAYISVSGSSSARLNLVIDGEETAINALEATEAEAEGLKDGKYFIGGKIVLVKNGVKYGANGQKLN